MSTALATEAKNKAVETNAASETGTQTRARRAVVPEYTVSRGETGYAVRVEMPGVAEKDLEITVKDRLLTVRGQTKALSYEGLKPVYTELTDADYAAGFRLSDDIDTEAIGASLENGILTITLPKMKERMPRTITVNG